MCVCGTILFLVTLLLFLFTVFLCSLAKNIVRGRYKYQQYRGSLYAAARNFSSETFGSEWKFTKACFILLFPLGVSFWSYVCHTFLRFYLCLFLRSLLINIHTRIFLWLSCAKVYQTCMSYIRTSQRMVPLIFFAFPFRWILVCFFFGL